MYQCNGCGAQFATVEEINDHTWSEFDKGNDHGGYSMVSGERYFVKTGQFWVVDVPAKDEVGHWEYR